MAAHRRPNSSPSEEPGTDFTARAYQVELFEHAKKQNSILVLGTGSGKTFISILLIKELAHQIRGNLADGCKRTVFVVNTVPLVYQQAEAIETHTALKVGKYEGSMNVDIWSREKWEEEIEKHEVLVMVAQILHDIVVHAKLKMSSINLLILDECHHTSGNHPMREVMRQYAGLKSTSPLKCPRILGLTACVIHKKCKPQKVHTYMNDLESALDSALVTSTFTDEVIRHSTAPRECTVVFEMEREDSQYKAMIKAQLRVVNDEIQEMQNIEQKFKKYVMKKLNNIEKIMDELGDWCVARAIKFEVEDMQNSEEEEEIPATQELIKLLCNRLEQIYQYCVNYEQMEITNPINHISNKVKRLLDILRACKTEVYGLIFVEMRNTAKILYDLLRHIAETNADLAFVNALYVIGSNTRASLDINLAKLEQRKQTITLNKFRRGECNFIVSTSVLEEGVDIRKCNIVIRFSVPPNYRSYVQSRGRARALPSRYILMTTADKMQNMAADIEVYKKIEEYLNKMCHNRQLPTDVEVSRHYARDLIIPPYEPYGCDGPKITMNSAIPLVNVYCGHLPHDKFTDLAPQVKYEHKKNVTSLGLQLDEAVRAKLRLPMNAPLKEEILGDWMENKDLAKKSAALNLCRRLHEMRELNEYLRPKDQKDEVLIDGLVEFPEEFTIQGTAAPGTRKRRQIYDRAITQAFVHQPNGHFYLYLLKIKSRGPNNSNIKVDSSLYNGAVGILCMKELVHFPFPLYFSKWGEVVIEPHFVKEYPNIDSKVMCGIEHFHQLIYKHLLHLNPSVFEFDPQNSGVFIVPLTKLGFFDIDLLQKLRSVSSLVPEVTQQSTQRFHFERSVYEDSIIYPLYSPREIYYVVDIIEDQTPLSTFPDNTRGYNTYEDYYWLKYECKVTNKTQPLLTAKHMVKELNYLKKGKVKDTNKRSRDPPQFIPELCGVIPLKASLWWQITLIPSVIHRLNSFSVAHELGNKINIPCQSHHANLEPLEFSWTEDYAKLPTDDPMDNLAVSLMSVQNQSLHPMMLLQALTLRQTDDNFDMERLEILGDSFLKYIIAEHLFLKYKQEHEGQLSECRTKLICNKTLYALGKMNDIPESIQSFKLYPRGNSLVPGYDVKNSVSALLHHLNVPHDVWPELSDFGSPDNIKSEVKEKINERQRGSCYNPWSQHELADKSVADVIEALIGMYLLVCGRGAAINFLHNLGLGVSKGKSLLMTRFQVQSALVNQEHWANDELNKYYRKYCLDRLEKKIGYTFKDKSFILQALTHSSHKQTVTDCYQRLEFLGDAVLDFLVTGLVFSRYPHFTPGQVSDLRSHYVNNETLAEVCVKAKLEKHLLHMAPKLEATIDKYITSLGDLKEDEDSEENEGFNTEDDVEDWQDVEVPKALGDIVEAIIGAVYLDSGRSIKKAWDVVIRLMGDVIREKMTNIPINCVRQLYEKMPDKVKIEMVEREEGDNVAKCKVIIKDHFTVIGKGKNNRTAKMAAARKALAKLQT